MIYYSQPAVPRFLLKRPAHYGRFLIVNFYKKSTIKKNLLRNGNFIIQVHVLDGI